MFPLHVMLFTSYINDQWDFFCPKNPGILYPSWPKQQKPYLRVLIKLHEILLLHAYATPPRMFMNKHVSITRFQRWLLCWKLWIKHFMVRQGLKEGTRLNIRMFSNCSCKTNRIMLKAQDSVPRRERAGPLTAERIGIEWIFGRKAAVNSSARRAKSSFLFSAFPRGASIDAI